VAIKFIAQSDKPAGDLEAEAALTRKLADTNASVVQIFEFGNDPPHIIMQLCASDVRHLMTAPKSRSEAIARAELVENVARTLAIAHGQGYTHRDVKPRNILLTKTGRSLLADWGLATSDLQFAQGTAPPGVTEHYAAPEQIDRQWGPIGPRADVYSLGVVLFELLTGSRPPRADSRILTELKSEDSAAFLSILDSSPLPIVRSVCEIALALKQNERYADAADMAGAIRDVIEVVERPRTFQPVDFTGLVRRKQAEFFGREWLFDEIDAWAKTGSDRMLIVMGEPGSGKSAVIAELVPELLVPRDQTLDASTDHGKAVNRIASRVIAFHFCEYGREDDALNASRFVASIAAMLVKTLSDHATQFGVERVQAAFRRDPVIAFKEAVLNPLCQIEVPEGELQYLLIDALDEAVVCQDGTGPSIVEVLARNISHLPPWLRIIATVRRGDSSAHRFNSAASPIDLEVVDSDDDARRAAKQSDLRGYIVGRLGSPNLAELVTDESRRTCETPKSIQGRIANELLAKADDNFLYAVEALRQMEETGSLDVSKLPSGLFGLYDGYLRRHYPERAGYEALGAMKVLTLLAAAFAPPPKRLLDAASNLDDDQLRKVRSNLGTYVVEVDGAVRFYHRSFRDWLVDNDNRTYGVATTHGHYLWASYGFKSVSDDPRRADEYLCRELVWHLWRCTQDTNVERRKGARDWLVDLYGNDAYIRRCRELRGIEAVVQDFGLVLNAIPHGQDKANSIEQTRAAAFVELSRASGKNGVAEGVSWYRTVPNISVRCNSLLVSPDGSNLLLGYRGGLMEWRIDAAERGYFEKRLTWREGGLEDDEVREPVPVRPLSWHPCRDEALLIIGDQGKSAAVIWRRTEARPSFSVVALDNELDLFPIPQFNELEEVIVAIDNGNIMPLGCPVHACWAPSGDAIYLANENGSVGIVDLAQESWSWLRDGVHGLGPTGLAVVGGSNASLLVVGPGPLAQLLDGGGAVQDELQFEGVQSMLLVGAHGNRVILRLGGGQRSGQLCVIEVEDRRIAANELSVNGVACLLPGGRWLAVGDDTGGVSVWSVSGAERMSFAAHTCAVESIAAGGGVESTWTLCTAGADHVGRVWRLKSLNNG
jgi:hypothetical protein